LAQEVRAATQRQAFPCHPLVGVGPVTPQKTPGKVLPKVAFLAKNWENKPRLTTFCNASGGFSHAKSDEEIWLISGNPGNRSHSIDSHNSRRFRIVTRRTRKSNEKIARHRSAKHRPLFESLEPRLVLDAGPLWISEFMANNKTGVVDDYGAHSDWIEIRNPTQADVNLQGWSLTDSAANLAECKFPAMTLPKGGYLFVFASGKASGDTIITGPGGQLHTNFNINKDGEYLALVQPDGTIASEYSPAFPAQSPDISYGWSNDLTTKGFFTLPTPGAPNTADPVADLNRQVVINEIMYHPGNGDWGQTGYVAENPKEEFIELFNRGATAVNIGGWKFTQGVNYTLPASTTIAASGYLAVVADTAAFIAKYPGVTNYVGGWIQSLPNNDESLANNGEKIELSDQNGNRIDAVTYASEGDWALRQIGDVYPGQPSWWRGWTYTSPADAGKKSLELINSALSSDHGQNWAASIADGGTPGAANGNTALTPDVAPMILDVTHTPAIPKSTDPVTITVGIVDEAVSGQVVKLHYRVDKTGTPDAFTVVVMYDDGPVGGHGDAIAGDGIFTAVLPSRADRTIVEFYVDAKDAGNHSRTWPAPTDTSGTQGANALYQVDNTTYAGDQPTYKLIIPQAEWASWTNLMNSVSNGHFSDATMNATLIAIDGTGTEVRYGLDVGNRGAGTSTANPHNLHLSIPNDQPLHGDTALNFNTRTLQAQVAGNAIFAAAGLPSNYGVPVQVRVNGVNLANPSPPSGGVDSYQFGSYFRMDGYDSEWANSNFPDDPNGNIYKGVWYFDGVGLTNPADFRYLGDLTSPHTTNPYRLNYGPSGPTSSSGGYARQSNKSDDDWSDLVALTKTFDTTQTPDAAFLERLNQNVNIDEWLKYFAVNSLIGNMETALGTGTGDDYSMYRGLNDPRFQLLMHDLDTVLGQGDEAPDFTRSIFKAADIAAISRLLKNPATAPRYYATLKNLIDTLFSPAQINPLLDRVLGDWVTPDIIDSMKAFVVHRINDMGGVLSQIPQTISISTALTQQNGYYRTTTAMTSLTGKANAINTRSVLVNGVAATWTAWQASWSATNITLNPGINRVLVQSLNADGAEIERAYLDIWRDTGTMTNVSGTLSTGTTTWSAATGPYHVTANLTVPEGATLVIQAGTTVFFDANMGITVQGGRIGYTDGRLVADGTDTRQIRFALTPTASGNWGGITFATLRTSGAFKPTASRADNHITYAVFDRANSNSRAIRGTEARMVLDHLDFLNQTTQYLTLDETSFTLSNSRFPDIVNAELVHVWGFPDDGVVDIIGNRFGKTTGYNDVIDITGLHSTQTGAPASLTTTRLLNNIFNGGSDDGIDMDATNALIEGNVFMHIHADDPARESLSHAVSTGFEGNVLSRITVTRNLFYDVDHAMLSKDGGFITATQNTFVHITMAAVNLYEVRSGQYPGEGVYLDGNIFYDIPKMFERPTGIYPLPYPTSIVIKNSIYPMTTGEPVTWAANNNIVFDPNDPAQGPRLANTTSVTDPRVDFYLMPGSPAIAAGSNGRDMGGLIAAGASISGEPASPTFSTAATLTVGGPEIWGYKYRLDDGSWSAEQGQMKTLTSLVRNGTTATATLAGHGYQEGDIVDISGVPQQEYNGAFTIFNVTGSTFDFAVSSSAITPATGTVRAKRREPIVLTGLANGDHHVDVIVKSYGGIWQDAAAAVSSKAWTVDTTLASHVRINEVLADNHTLLPHNGTFIDLLELYSDGQGMVNLADMSLTDDPLVPRKFVFAPGSTLGQGQYLLLYGGIDPITPENHLGFSMDDRGGGVFLFNSLANGGGLVDSVEYGVQLPDKTIGRVADGSWKLTVPTLGGANQAAATGDPRKLKINEWLADEKVSFPDDYIELYNPDSLPVDLGGLYLTDNPVEFAHQVEAFPVSADAFRLKPLNFIDAGTFAARQPVGAFAYFIADGAATQSQGHLTFKLAPEQGQIALFGSDEKLIDQVFYGSQTMDVSEGRTPLGANTYDTNPIPTRGLENIGTTTGTVGTDTWSTLFDFNQSWRYNQTANLDSTPTWKDRVFSTETSWPQGPGLLYVETAVPTDLRGTPLTLGRLTYYFRTHFTYNGPIDANTHLFISTYVDDGAVIYVNGQEAKRLHFTNYPAPTAINYSTPADDHEFTLESRIEIPTTALVSGDNVIAVEVHQKDSGSSDIVWGAKLEVEEKGTSPVVLRDVETPSNIAALADGLRITEMMYQPAGNPAAEYLKMQNVGTSDLQLDGVRLNRAVEFVFPKMTLKPGEYTVVVRDIAAFQATYGHSIPIAGQYVGALDNSGEEVVLQLPDPFGDGIVRFTYSPNWYPSASGGGKAMKIVAPTAPAASWDDAASWQAVTPNWNALVVAPSDWTSAGLTLEHIADGMLHIYRTGTTTDAVPPLLATDVIAIDVAGSGAGDVLTVVSLGADVPRLTVTGATLRIDRDDAIPTATIVNIDGGAFQSNGHSNRLGSLTIEDVVTADSILCDSLTIGTTARAAANRSHTASPSHTSAGVQQASSSLGGAPFATDIGTASVTSVNVVSVSPPKPADDFDAAGKAPTVAATALAAAAPTNELGRIVPRLTPVVHDEPVSISDRSESRSDRLIDAAFSIFLRETPKATILLRSTNSSAIATDVSVAPSAADRRVRAVALSAIANEQLWNLRKATEATPTSAVEHPRRPTTSADMAVDPLGAELNEKIA
jgi:hypothetical protein